MGRYVNNSGFDLFNYWIDVHSNVTKDRRLSASRVSTQAKKLFNSHMQRVKAVYAMGSDDIKHAILFSYTHNPLLLPSLSGYGNLGNLERALGQYSRWYRDNASLCAEVGIDVAILQTMPRRTSVDNELMPYLKEMIAAMDGELTL